MPSFLLELIKKLLKKVRKGWNFLLKKLWMNIAGNKIILEEWLSVLSKDNFTKLKKLVYVFKLNEKFNSI